MDDAMAQRGRSLEDAFFRQRSTELIEKQKKLEQMKKDKETLAQVSGIRNLQVLDRLVESGISPATLTALSLLPLVEVAWADGHLDAQEHQAIMAAAAKMGFQEGSLAHSLLEAWLKERPARNLSDAWTQYINGLRETLPPAELGSLKSELLEKARLVAGSSGGILGVAKVSSEEAAVLRRLESAFSA